ncbi:glycosyltransferase [Rodentibacter haemolyticus]|uniref:Glycosyltransferase n=1 Tax=Rodentibacter haemolyticus TaxID=2778911 RepID=A0ABX6UWN6_9PAST|nr:glycosyltransferase [Rodentibacter haemolyticus]QPB42343.1 glycosyltransferase [Rodentibacter haemolyticus]
MKNLLVVSTSPIMCGVQVVLAEYLNILNQYEQYHIDLVYMMNRGDFKLNEIPKEIDIHQLITPIETEFLIYIGETLDTRDLAHEKRAYYQSWRNALIQKLNQGLLEKINSKLYQAIIVFNNERASFDHFLEKFDINSKIPVIRWVHSYVDFTYWNEHNRYVLNKYQHIFGICDEMQTAISAKLAEIGVTQTQVHSLYNPVKIENIKEKAKQYCIEDSELLTDDFIVEVCRLDEGQKNLIQLINIFSTLKQKGVKEKLYIIGDGPSKALLQQHISQLGLEADCLLLGYRSNPFPFMKKAKLFVHTARFEGLPTVLIESMVCGTPVVAMDCPVGPKEILGYGKYGVLVPLFDEKAFVEKTFELLQNEMKRQTYIQSLPEAIMPFSEQTITNKLDSLLNQILG